MTQFRSRRRTGEDVPARKDVDKAPRPMATGSVSPESSRPRSGATQNLQNEPNRRAEKSAARRQAIVAAALEEFSARGFAAARLEDVAKRAGVAKGTIYLHFRDKEALFEDLVATTIVPFVAGLERLPPADMPIRTVLENFVALFIAEIFGTERRNVLRLVMTEGPRFPKLAEFYYHNVVERAVAAMRALLERARERGELRHEALLQFPHLVVAPALMAIIWTGLFDTLRAARHRGADAHPSRRVVRRRRRAMKPVLLACLRRRRSWSAAPRRSPPSRAGSRPI